MKKMMPYYKKIFKMSCPCCGNNLDFPVLRHFTRLWKLITLQEKYSENSITICLKCHCEIIINDNRPVEFLFRFMIALVFIIFNFASLEFYTQFRQYWSLYYIVMMALFIYVRITQKVQKLN